MISFAPDVVANVPIKVGSIAIDAEPLVDSIVIVDSPVRSIIAST